MHETPSRFFAALNEALDIEADVPVKDRTKVIELCNALREIGYRVTKTAKGVLTVTHPTDGRAFRFVS